MIYTFEQWQAAGTFDAEPGQEITADVYNEMLNCIPPEKLPTATARKAHHLYGIPVHAGFLMGEPHSSDSEGPLYMAFCMNHYTQGPRYFYIGLSHKETPLNGIYYYMDCMNAFVNDGLFPASEFKDDADAIRTAADYEATLYKYEYQDGQQINCQALYEPRYC